ncbi:MAG TPA: F0F1 ATP synthase subunit A, partial [Burkholderiales bacterium]|nr:F0F1 ATP synthase subunit A [Burkholderiales bacterium]
MKLPFHIGLIWITTSIVVTWGIMFLLFLFSWLATRRLASEPGPIQTALEAVVTVMMDAVEEVLPGKSEMLLPFIGTLWIFILVANLSGIVPGISAPTGNLSVTAALAFLVFLSVHWYGIRSEGLKHYLLHYTSPSPILLPFHLISEISRTVALAVRLFGNIMSLEMAALLVLLVGGLFVPIPLLMLHIVEALVQAYIFGMLALIYV